ncbi:MAG: protein kinase, partial [Chloroflexi bacterium]|nr:protein kinase [Chloroflexota bacterium]
MKILELDQFVGQTVNSCRVEQLLSQGRMNVVYRAQQIRPNRLVAITLFLPSEEMSAQARQQFRERFLLHGPKLTTMRHPNLLPLYGYGIWTDFPYLITPYRTEGSVAATLEHGAYTPARTLRVLESVTAGLEYAHRNGLVHGMLTPAHLLVSREQPLQIAGLGLLPLLERRGILPIADIKDYRLTIAGTPLAAPKYLAAEYLQGQSANIRSDIYSLGVILFELLRGSLLPQEA